MLKVLLLCSAFTSLVLVSCTCTRAAPAHDPVADTAESKEDVTNCDHANPYDAGTGHYAGYEWAEENEPTDCDGNSDSFNEGCETYLNQQSCEEAKANQEED